MILTILNIIYSILICIGIIFIILILGAIYYKISNISQQLPSICGKFSPNSKYGKTFSFIGKNIVTTFTFSSKINTSGLLTIIFSSDSSPTETYPDNKWTYDKSSCTISLEWSYDFQTKVINVHKNIQVNNTLKFDSNGSLIGTIHSGILTQTIIIPKIN
jgi:hypothetical protein